MGVLAMHALSNLPVFYLTYPIKTNGILSNPA